MTLLNGMALLASSALIVPVLIHLRRSRKAKRIEWPAMQFLMQTVVSRNRGLMIEEFLLLLLRCLLIVLFALAMARPLIAPAQPLRWVLFAILICGGLCLLTASVTGQWSRAGRIAGVAGSIVILSMGIAMLSSNSLPITSLRDQCDVAIVIDGSDSMQIEQNSESPFERAISESRSFVRQLAGRSTVTIIMAGPLPQVIEGSPFTNLSLAEQRLESLKPTGGAGNLGQAIELAASAVHRAPNPSKQVLIYSDNQVRAWDSVSDPRLTATSPKSPETTTAISTSEPDSGVPPMGPVDDRAGAIHYAARVAELPDNPTNLAVTSAVIRTPLPTVHRPVVCEFEIFNSGASTVRDIPVTLFVDDQPAATESVQQLEAGTTATVRFVPVMTTPGQHVLSAQIDLSDVLQNDNSAQAVISVAPHLSLLLINGNHFANRSDQSATFVRMALSPGGDHPKADLPVAPHSNDQQMIRFQMVTPTELEKAGALDSYDVVFLCDIPRLPQKVAQRLATYVAQGGSLWIIPDSQLDAEFYNAWKAWPGDSKLLPGQFGDSPISDSPHQVPDEAPSLTIDFEHEGVPWFRQLQDSGEHDLADVRITNVRAFQTSEHVIPAIQLSNGLPLFAAHSVGKGRVLVQTISLTPRDSNLIARISFPVLIHLWAQTLAKPDTTNSDVMPATDLVVELARPANDLDFSALQLITPSGSERSADVRWNETTGLAHVGLAVSPGLYHLRAHATDDDIHSFVVSRDPAESDLAAASPEKLADFITIPNFRWLAESDTWDAAELEKLHSDQTRSHREIWKLLAFGVLWLLALEPVVIRWIRRRRSAPLSAIPAMRWTDTPAASMQVQAPLQFVKAKSGLSVSVTDLKSGGAP